MATCDKDVVIPPGDRKWYWFIIISVVIYFAGVILIIIGKVISYLVERKKEDKEEDEDEEEDDAVHHWYINMKEGAGNLVSAQTLQGKILVVLSVIFNLAACALYAVETNYPIEHCLDTNTQTLWRVEICLNAFFIFHLAIRFIAARDKLSFWVFDLLTYVDLLTVPTVFVALKLGRNWLGLRFLRVLYMINLADILQFLNVVHAGSSLEITGTFGNLIAIWLSSAGFVHLLENSGDPWLEPSNNQTLNLYESIYFLVVTMSTVGYGDIYCKTYLGRLFAMLFICVVVGWFASNIPVFVDFFASHTKYDRQFKPTPGKKYIIVAGHITDDSMAGFFNDFLHPDRDDHQTTVVFLAPHNPSSKMQGDLQRHLTQSAYFKGTVYKFLDCHRTKMRGADAVIILCNKQSTNPFEEDRKNMTRVISVKNYGENIRCIVQLMMTKSKSYLLNCPQWNPEKGDNIVCINELKLGCIAQSCVAPGFTTLLANLFAMRSDTHNEEQDEDQAKWKAAYMTGAANEMYTAKLSNSFAGMTFEDAVELCFEKLSLLLIAIEMNEGKDPFQKKYFRINPHCKSLRIQENTRGFFIAQDHNDVIKASNYCSKCHRGFLDTLKMDKCKCKKGRKPSSLISDDIKKGDAVCVNLVVHQEEERVAFNNLPSDENNERSTAQNKFDQTATFHWKDPEEFENVLLSITEASEKTFYNHVVVLVLSEPSAPCIGLRQLILPLRASNIQFEELMEIIILGNKEFLQKEWEDDQLCNFPKIHVVDGKPFQRDNLRAINVNLANMCVLLSPGLGSDTDEHQALFDKEVILVTLNLKAMEFDLLPEDTYVSQSQVVFRKDSEVGREIAKKIRGSRNSLASSLNEFVMKKVTEGHVETGAEIPMITELVCDSNAMYIDQDDMNLYDDEGIFLTQSYASGGAFTVSVLDSLVSATYFNNDILTLVRRLVAGSINDDLELLLREGLFPDECKDPQKIQEMRNRCRVAQIDLSDPKVMEIRKDTSLFGDLFLKLLRRDCMICLGLYRYRDLAEIESNNDLPRKKKRYVITFPPFNFVLHSSDKVFVLKQFEDTPPGSPMEETTSDPSSDSSKCLGIVY